MLARGLVIAGGAAGFAVHEAVLADADFEYGLAEAAVLVALALVLDHFALGTTAFGGTGSRGHRNNVALPGGAGNVPLVTWVRGQMCRGCFLRPFGLVHLKTSLRRAYAVGCILPPLRGYAVVPLPYNSEQ